MLVPRLFRITEEQAKFLLGKQNASEIVRQALDTYIEKDQLTPASSLSGKEEQNG